VEDFGNLPSALIPVPQAVVSPANLQPTGSPVTPLTAPTALKVLLVEDNKSTLMIMSRLLRQKLNYNVLVASSVADALRVADEENGQFDLVISDIGLPDGTGLQLMVALKAKYNLRVRSLSSSRCVT
jgi:response regulator RpfG family c-di-GMP phosphodiesterase